MFAPSLAIGRVVHYRSHGSADGLHPPACVAADITAVGAWLTTNTTEHGDGLRTLDQHWDNEACALAVRNPNGLFFAAPCAHDESGEPGTWHWPLTCGHIPTAPRPTEDLTHA
ncbi:hypothetical protein GCM10010174_03280 [Kutzneria viridogrisea]|uniref:Uncharacterized protein n=1 Tax=Kutzneria viridogrisea TaxID=47990 RepID=A0ABR6BR86_9PSEU|nr:hypothetical protein [Kutzneria viridogrisea]